MNGHLRVHTVFELPALEDTRTNCDVRGGVGLHQDSVSADTKRQSHKTEPEQHPWFWFVTLVL